VGALENTPGRMVAGDGELGKRRFMGTGFGYMVVDGVWAR